MALSRAQILASKPRTITVAVPDWQGEVLIRPLTVGGLSRFMATRETLTSADSLALLVALSVVDELGQPVFDPDNLVDLQGLGLDSVKIVADEVLKLNQLDKTDEKKAPSEPLNTDSSSLPNVSE